MIDTQNLGLGLSRNQCRQPRQPPSGIRRRPDAHCPSRKCRETSKVAVGIPDRRRSALLSRRELHDRGAHRRGLATMRLGMLANLHELAAVLLELARHRAADQDGIAVRIVPANLTFALSKESR